MATRFFSIKIYEMQKKQLNIIGRQLKSMVKEYKLIIMLHAHTDIFVNISKLLINLK